MRYSDFVVIDTETTVLDHKQLPVELGAIRYRNGVEVARFSKLANPGGPISFWTQQITGITNRDIVSAQPLCDVLPEFLSFIGDTDYVVGHNIAFDIRVIFNACELCEINKPNLYNRAFDTCSMAKQHLESASLTNCAIAFQIPREDAHRAAADCKTTGELFLILQERYDEEPTRFGQLSSITRSGKHEMPKVDPRFRSESSEDRIERIVSHAFDVGVDIRGIAFAFSGCFHNPFIGRWELPVILNRLGAEMLDRCSLRCNVFVLCDDVVSKSVQDAKKLSENPKSNLVVVDAEQFMAMLGVDRLACDCSIVDCIRQVYEEREAEEKKKEEEKQAKKFARDERKQQRELEALRPKRSTTRSVAHLSPDGSEIIHVFASLVAAAEAVGITCKPIRDAANGVQRTAGGFRWQWIDANN